MMHSVPVSQTYIEGHAPGQVVVDGGGYKQESDGVHRERRAIIARDAQ